MTAIKLETPKKTNTGLVVAIVIGLGLCGLVALGLIGGGGAVVYFGQVTAQARGTQTELAAQAQATAARASLLTEQAKATEAAAATFAAETATAEAEAATATAEAQYAASTATARSREEASTATALARQGEATPTMLVPAPVAQNWPLLVFDAFDSNFNRWPVGPYSDDYGSGRRSVSSGKYQWTATASEGRLWRMSYEKETVSDFYVAADFLLVSGGPQAHYGLVLRDTGSDYYLFDVSSNQQFGFYLWYGSQWTTLLSPVRSAAIVTGEVNRLAALAQGSQFTLFINGRRVAQETDSRLAEGQAGFAVNITTQLDEAGFEFDNFELRAP